MNGFFYDSKLYKIEGIESSAKRLEGDTGNNNESSDRLVPIDESRRTVIDGKAHDSIMLETSMDGELFYV